MMLQGTAPDGTVVMVDTEDRIPADEMCVDEDALGFLCTLRAGHPGPWHVADAAVEIAAVWAVAL